MRFNQFILLIAIFWGVSFNAYSSYNEVYNVGNSLQPAIQIGNIHAHFNWIIGYDFNGRVATRIATQSSSKFIVYAGSQSLGSVQYRSVSDCPDGQIITGDTFVCGPDPWCDIEYPPLHADAQEQCSLLGGTVEYQCVDASNHNLECDIANIPNYCSSQPYLDLKEEEQNKCWAEGGDFSAICDEDNDSAHFSCDVSGVEPCDPNDPFCENPPTDPDPCEDYDPNDPNAPLCPEPDPDPDPEPEPCIIGSPSWPDCLPPEDELPPAPEIPGLNPNPGPGPSDPTAPLEPPPVEDVPPEDGNDNDVVEAITNLNKDQNQLFKDLTDNMNTNAANNQAYLDAINENIIIAGQATYDGLNSLIGATNDANKLAKYSNDLLISLNNGNQAGFDSVKSALDSGFSSVVDAIGDINGGSVTRNGCDTFNCDGNPQTCYLAKQQFLEECANKGAFGEQGEGELFLNNLDEWVNDESRSGDALLVEGGDISNSLEYYNSENGFDLDARCPEPYIISIPELGQTYEVDYEPFCDLADVIGYLLLVSTSLFSVFLIVKFS